ncbi:MAG: DUF4838 domain-containing protein, partial [Candidatus Nealsonbacteria bacterium]
SNGVTITGKTAIAVRWGAYYLLDEKLGVRWFFKSPVWTVVPSSLVDIGTFNETHEPDSFWRMIQGPPFVGQSLSADWVTHNRMFGAQRYMIWHSYWDILNFATGWNSMTDQQKLDYYNANPTQFLPNNRYPNWPWQLNPENADVIQWSKDYAENVLDTLTPSTPSYNDALWWGGASISPNDCGGFDPPLSDTQDITNSVYTLSTAIALHVQTSDPGKYVGVLNYAHYADIPNIALEDNLIALVTGGLSQSDLSNKERIDGLQGKGIVVGWYDYLDIPNWYYEDSRISYDTLNTWKYQVSKEGITYVVGESTDTWGGRGGLTMYVTSKLSWDSNLIVDDIFDDFYNKAFGPAAQVMKHYYRVRNKDDTALAASFNDLRDAEILAAGNSDVLARIRHLEYYNRYLWKWHNIGITNLSTADLENFYTFITKIRDTYILTYYYPEAAIRAELINNRGKTSSQVNALQNFTLPTAGEAATWLNEALAAFSGETGPEAIDPRFIDLEALGDTAVPAFTALYGVSRDIIVPSSGNETITVQVKAVSGIGLQWYNTYGVMMDYWSQAGAISDWMSVNFTTQEAGNYLLHVSRTNPLATYIAYVNVPGRPAAIVADPKRDLFRLEKDAILFNAPAIVKANSQYFYVPTGTPSFTFGADVASPIHPLVGQLVDPALTSYSFNWGTDNEMTINSPVAGLWTVETNSATINYYWLIGIPPLVWHDPQYLLVEAGGTPPPPPPPSSFTISSVDKLYFFRDRTNLLQITGTNFNLSTDFSLQFIQDSAVISSFTSQPLDTSTLTLNLTSTQTNTLPIGFYDMKVVRTIDGTSETYTKQILVTIPGDLWSGTATEEAEQKRDGKVSMYDISRMFSKWGSSNATDLAEADINSGPDNISQNKIDLFDANLIMRNWRL